MKSPGIDIKSAQRFAILLCLALASLPVHAERADRDKPIHLEADQVSIDDAKQVSTFEGKVLLSQGTMSIRGDKLVTVQDKNGFAHGTATGQPASFRQKREGSDEYVEGYGDRIEYDAANETIDFFGHARMTRNQDEVRGDHITYSARTEIFQVRSAPGQPGDGPNKGRVQVILQPKNRTNATPPAPLPIKPSGILTPSGAPEHE